MTLITSRASCDAKNWQFYHFHFLCYHFYFLLLCHPQIQDFICMFLYHKITFITFTFFVITFTFCCSQIQGCSCCMLEKSYPAVTYPHYFPRRWYDWYWHGHQVDLSSPSSSCQHFVFTFAFSAFTLTFMVVIETLKMILTWPSSWLILYSKILGPVWSDLEVISD